MWSHTQNVHLNFSDKATTTTEAYRKHRSMPAYNSDIRESHLHSRFFKVYISHSVLDNRRAAKTQRTIYIREYRRILLEESCLDFQRAILADGLGVLPMRDLFE